METPKSKNMNTITFFLMGIIIGGFIIYLLSYNGIITPAKPTIYEKLESIGITYIHSRWEASILNDKTDVHQFREFNEIAQISSRPLMFELDRIYNIIWRLSPTQEDWISFYFYTDPD